MIGGDTDMRASFLDHAQHRGEHSPHRRYFHAIHIVRRRKRIVVPEQLVRTINEINLQPGTPEKDSAPTVIQELFPVVTRVGKRLHGAQ